MIAQPAIARGSLLAPGALASFVRGLGPAAWFRFNTGITVTGAGVSQWDDQSGNARHLKQGTDTNRPALQADGSILFDGADNFLKCDAFTFTQPETIYLLFKQVSWTEGEFFIDGNAFGQARVYQNSSTPNFRASTDNGTTNTALNPNLAVDTYGAVAVVLNGASSLTQVNATTPATGNAGSANMGGFTLGARADGVEFSNIQVKEVILYAAAHDAGTRARIIRYLARVGGI